MIQIIAIGVMVLALAGAWYSHNRSQQEIGRAEAVAVYERQQKEAEALNTQRALEGEAYALKLLAAAEKRAKVQAAAIVAARQQREVIYVDREKVDPELKEWGNTAVPLFAANRLRERTQSIAATASNRSVPVALGMVSAAPVADPAGIVEESWLARIRRRLAGLTGGAVD